MKKILLFICIAAAAGAKAQLPGTWTQKANFPAGGRAVATSFNIGNKGYIGLGYRPGGPGTDLWEYDPSTDTWTQKANFGGVLYSTTSFSIGNKAYVGTGDDENDNRSNQFWEYNAGTNAWIKKADFPGAAREGATSFTIGSKGYLGTGHDQFGVGFGDFWEYDPSTDKWTQKANFGGTARGQASGFSIGSKGYIGTGNYTSDFWEYDPSTDRWTKKADVGGGGRSGGVGFSIGNKGYIGIGFYHNDFWEYDPSNDEWQQKADFGGTQRNFTTGFSIGGKGYIGMGFLAGTFFNDFWEYTPGSLVTPPDVPVISATSTGLCRGSSTQLSIQSGNLNDASEWKWYSGSCGGTLVGSGTFIDVSPEETTTYYVRGEGPSVTGDCAQIAINVDQPQTYYEDADGDGYGSTTTAMFCSSTAPAGYSTNNTDCNDDPANGGASVHAPVRYYVDADHDGYGSTTTAMLCSSTAPAGYSTNNTDCNDDPANGGASVHAPVRYYVDADHDGYGSTTTAMLCSSTAPVGYSTNNTDCNDDPASSGASVHPGATEICDGIDNNCNGTIDEGCPDITMSIGDASVTEGNMGKKTMNFIVTLSKASSKKVTVNYVTQNGTATAGSDYVAKSGTLTFKQKTVSQTIGITINGDKAMEPGETFKVMLSNAVNATIIKPVGTGTILNDDGATLARTAAEPDNALNIHSVKIAPNPASNILQIRLSGYTGAISIQLVNLQGMVVKQEKIQPGRVRYSQQQMNVTDIVSGNYFLVVTDGNNNRQTEKVIIAR